LNYLRTRTNAFDGKSGVLHATFGLTIFGTAIGSTNTPATQVHGYYFF